MDEEVTFPIFLTEAEMRELITRPCTSGLLWHKLNEGLSIITRGESCCDD